MQKLSNLRWVAGIAVYYVQRIREGALPSEKLHLEKVTYQESILSPKVTNLNKIKKLVELSLQSWISQKIFRI